MFDQILNLTKNKLKLYSGYLLVILSVLLVISLTRNILKIGSVGKKIEEAEKSLEKLRVENQDLLDQVESLQSETHIEKQLRDKLGLVKEGEIILVLPEEEILRKLAPKQAKEEEVLPDPIWKKWMKLFGIYL